MTRPIDRCVHCGEPESAHHCWEIDDIGYAARMDWRHRLIVESATVDRVLDGGVIELSDRLKSLDHHTKLHPVELKRMKEQGENCGHETLVTRMLDRAMEKAIDDGSLHIEEIGGER